jgi:hypothetical protein
MADLKSGDLVKGATVVRATAKVVEFTCACGGTSVKSLVSWSQAAQSTATKRITCKQCARRRCKAAANNAGLGNGKGAM